MPAQNVSVSAEFEKEAVDPILYKMDLSKATKDGQVSYKLVQSDLADQTNFVPTEAEIKKGDVADFGTAPDEAHPYTQTEVLDGWGYKHWALNNMKSGTTFNDGRQTNVFLNKTTNTAYVSTVSNDSGNGILTFLLNNVDNIDIPEGTKICYSFDVVAKLNTNPQNNAERGYNLFYGISQATDATNPSAIADSEQTLKAKVGTDTIVPVIVIVDTANKSWSISVDGGAAKTGTWDSSGAPTGVYVRGNGGDKSTSGEIGIRNLVVAVGEETRDISIKYIDSTTSEEITDVDGKTTQTVTAIDGVPYHAADALKVNFDDKADNEKTKRYIYNAEDSETDIEAVGADAAEIKLVFDPEEYKETTFEVKVGGAVKENVPIKLSGSATKDSAVAFSPDSPVTTTQDGTVSVKMLDGTYTYEIDDNFSNGYAGTGGAQAVKVGQKNEITLIAHSQTLGVVKIDDSKFNGKTILSGKERSIGTLSNLQYERYTSEEDNVPMEEVNPTVTYEVQKEGQPTSDVTVDNTTGAVTVKAAASGSYSITAKVGEVTSDPYVITVADEGTEVLKSVSDDFEGATSLFTELSNLTSNSADTPSIGAISDTVPNKVLKANRGTAKMTLGVNKVEPIKEGDVIEISFDAYLGYIDHTAKTQFIISNTEGKELFHLQYPLKTTTTTDKTLKSFGTDMTATKTITGGSEAAGTEFTATEFNLTKNGVGGGSQNVNTWSAFTDVNWLQYVNKFTVKIDYKNKKITAELTHGLATPVTYVYEHTFEDEVTTEDFNSFELSITEPSHGDERGTAQGIDNLVTKITRSAAE